jgi:hypothetical protein
MIPPWIHLIWAEVQDQLGKQFTGQIGTRYSEPDEYLRWPSCQAWEEAKIDRSRHDGLAVRIRLFTSTNDHGRQFHELSQQLRG